MKADTGNLVTVLVLIRSCLSTHVLLSIGMGLTALPIARATVACNDTSTCEAAYRPGSLCKAGACTNPFVGGCLRRVRGAARHPRRRTCNSDDGPDPTACAPSPLAYEEVRIAPNNWESSMFSAWLLQILLSELLDVPTSVDTGPEGGALNFYDERNGFAYPTTANNFAALYKANEVGDCRDTAASCAHLITEMWQGKRGLNTTAVERMGNGMVGHVGWSIPRLAAVEDPSLTHYLGLAGPANRQKLADTFKRPLVWSDYCTRISPNNCTAPDDVAARTPSDAAEGGKYFVRGEYTGHFVATEKNNCTANPDCTGHIIDYPCTWSAYTASQLYWNDISLESDTPDGMNSYAYAAMVQILEASNATNSPIIIVWWYPDPMMDAFDFVKVALPEATRPCLDNRPEPKPDRCNATEAALVGKEVGSCGYNVHTLENYFAVSFRERSTETPVAVRSPGLQLVRNARFSDIDLQEIMVAWVSSGVDKYNYDPREAVCSWVSNNLDEGLNLRKFIPLGYPREVEDEVGYDTTLMLVSTVYGAVGALVAVLAGAATYKYRTKKQIKYAQAFFLYLFALGLFFVCLGGVMYSLVPSAGSCAARWWFVMIGFTFSLVPLLIKIAAINKLMNDAKKMRRTNVSKESVYKIVAVLVLLVVVYLAVWTGIDAPVCQSNLVLVSESGNLVEVHVQCASESMVWELIAFGWEAALICSAATVAFLSRKVTQAFNESRVVGNTAYAIFFCKTPWSVCRVYGCFIPVASHSPPGLLFRSVLVFRLLVFFLPDAVLQPHYKNLITSLLLTSESLITLGIYFGTKFRSIYKHEDDAKSKAAPNRLGPVMFLSAGNDDMCPLCERKLTKPERVTVAKNRRSAVAAVNNEMGSMVETPVIVKKVSDYDITSRSGSAEARHVRLTDIASVDISSEDNSPVLRGDTPACEEEAADATTEQVSVPDGCADTTEKPRSSELNEDTTPATIEVSNAPGVTEGTAEEPGSVEGDA